MRRNFLSRQLPELYSLRVRRYRLKAMKEMGLATDIRYLRRNGLDNGRLGNISRDVWLVRLGEMRRSQRGKQWYIEDQLQSLTTKKSNPYYSPDLDQLKWLDKLGAQENECAS